MSRLQLMSKTSTDYLTGYSKIDNEIPEDYIKENGSR